MTPFQKLLAQAKQCGQHRLAFFVDLDRAEDDRHRWSAQTVGGEREQIAHGRTGEEAFRRLLEALLA